MLRKIDCVMVRVGDLPGAVEFYTRVFGLRELWRDETSVGMAMAESDADVVLHTMDLPAGYGVHYLVDDVADAVATCERAGCTVREAPFDVAVGPVRRGGRPVRQRGVPARHEQGPAHCVSRAPQDPRNCPAIVASRGG